MSTENSWRLEAGLVRDVRYEKRFAIFPRICADGTKVWMKNYFNKFEVWNHPAAGEQTLGHTDYIESITEEEYIVRKLAETL